MYKYAQLKMFHHDCRIKVYIYYFISVDPKIVLVEDNFPGTKTFFVNYNKFQLQDQSQNIGWDVVPYSQKIMS